MRQVLAVEHKSTGRAEHSRETHGEAAATISRELVSLHKQFYGKGPVKAKTFLVNDTVLCMLEGGFTVVERTLIEAGRAAAVHEVRTSFQAAMGDRFTEVVERALGRKVRAYMSHVHTDPDVAAELFMLEPLDEPLLEAHHYQPGDSDG